MDRLISEKKVLDVINEAIRIGRFYCGKERTIEEIKAIPSAEPKTIIYSGDGYADGYMVYDMAECPSCGYKYEDGDKDWGLSYCPSCGQKLNWERSDKE